MFVFGSTSPTTEPNSPAGPRRPGSAPSPGVLDDALSTVFRTPVRLRAAGRTDTGVHATGQVAHVDVPADALPHAYPRTTRAGDEPSSCRWCGGSRGSCRPMSGSSTSPAPPAGFDARFSALRRHYVYRLSTAPYGVEPQQARFVTPGRARSTSTRWRRRRETWWGCTTSPRSAGIARAPPRSATCSGWTGRATATCVTAYVTADAFCWSMVRSLVGALLAVGERRREPGWCATPADRDAALQRLRGRAAARPDARRRGLPARRPTRGAHRRSPATCGRDRLDPARDEVGGLIRPCPPRCMHWRGGRASCPPRCWGRPGCRSDRHRGTTRWSARGKAGLKFVMGPTHAMPLPNRATAAMC